MTYIDFDGVILDTEKLLFEEWRKNPNHYLLSEKEKVEYIKQANWHFVLNNSPVINDALYYLRYMDPNTSFILTKIHSDSNEGDGKIKWLRQKKIKQRIILVPYYLRKVDMVDARNNILIDDSLKNLEEWANHGGIPIFFDIDNDNYDSWQQPNTKDYPKVLNLSRFK